MKILPSLSISVMITGSSANDATIDNWQLQWNPNCGTLVLWHPDYTAGWSGGFCSLQTTCNSPSYSTAAECCNAAYVGQSSNTCYSTAGIPVPTSAPVPGVVGTWYPNYQAGWEASKCINTLPLPPHGNQPLYATQLQCCELAYAGQTNNFCITNMDGSSTRQYGTQWYPKYDAAGTCINKLPLPPPGSRSYFTSKEECCQGTYAMWESTKAANCISGSKTTPVAYPLDSLSSNPSKAPATVSTSASPSKAPVTASPSASPSTASPSNTPTTLTPSESPSGSPVTASPSASPSHSPTASPSHSPTASPSQYCFPDRFTLKSAVDNYINENCAAITTCKTRTQYGEIGTWCVKHVTDMSTMFYMATSFNSNISNWNVGSVTSMFAMFAGASSFNSNISNWNVSSVTSMKNVFEGASSFNTDISNWNVGSVTNMGLMFWYATRFNQNLCPWGAKLPAAFNYGNAGNMFGNSGCLNKNSPTGPTGPWCAVTCPA